MFLHTLMHKQT